MNWLQAILSPFMHSSRRSTGGKLDKAATTADSHLTETERQVIRDAAARSVRRSFLGRVFWGR